MSDAQKGFAKGEQELQKTAQGFAQESGGNPMQQNGQASWSDVSSQAPANPAKTPPTGAGGNPALQGSPETGYAGTWTDPATGDIITSVIAPTPPQNQNNQNYPIIVEPQVSGGNYPGSYYGNGERNWQGGYHWSTSPDNPGYPPYQGQQPPYNMPPQPGWHPYYPGQPYPGFNPYPYPYPQPYPGYEHPGEDAVPPSFVPGMPGTMPPPINPGYRPLRPGQPGQNPGGIWQPGMNPPGQEGIPPQVRPPSPPQPSQPQLPMQPAGQSWQRSPFSPQQGQGGMFGMPMRGAN